MRVSDETMPLFDEMAANKCQGRHLAAEACAIHRDRMARRAADIDPNVRVRIERGCAVSAADYVDMMRELAPVWSAPWMRGLASLDALLMPTTSIVAPTIAEVADPKRSTLPAMPRVLRNTSISNFFDLCAISLPLKAKLPVGLMLMARNGHDRVLLRIAAAVEKAFAS